MVILIGDPVQPLANGRSPCQRIRLNWQTCQKQPDLFKIAKLDQFCSKYLSCCWYRIEIDLTDWQVNLLDQTTIFWQMCAFLFALFKILLKDYVIFRYSVISLTLSWCAQKAGAFWLQAPLCNTLSFPPASYHMCTVTEIKYEGKIR